MKTLAITSTKTLSFKKLKEPYRATYSKKQEDLASQIRDILASKCSLDKNGKNWESFLQNSFGVDVLIKPDSVKQQKIYVSAVNSYTEIEQEMINEYSPANKPRIIDFIDCVVFLKEKKSDTDNNLIITLLAAGAFIIGLMSLPANKNNIIQNITKKTIKSELKANSSDILKQDTLKNLIDLR